MDKRSLLFIVLTFLVIIAYSYINAPSLNEQTEKAQNASEAQQEQIPEPVLTETENPSDLIADFQLSKIKPSSNKIYIDTEMQSFIIDADRASIISCQLKNYYVTTDKSSEIELISEESNAEWLFPLDIVFFDQNMQETYESVPYSIVSGIDSAGIIKLHSPREIVFQKQLAESSIKKTIKFYPDKYGLDVSIDIENSDQNLKYALICGPDLILDREGMQGKGRYSQPDNIIFRLNEKNKGIKAEKIETDFNVLSKNAEFIALNDLYFVQVMLSKDMNATPFFTSNLIIGYAFSSHHADLSLYMGPKSKKQLNNFDTGLASLVDFGFFSIIASPLHKIIDLFYSFIGNYGIAIILLTLSIKLIFFPITFKSYLQMRRMSKLAPQMKEIRKKLKDQPQKMNQEIQALYKKHNVNPFSSCLPMFLQLPVLFALYRVLSIAIELRHQGFLWITDLAGPDPYMILPILMSVAMFFQQRLTPTSADPKQAKMMSILMPAIFFIMFRNLQAGLVLYWFTSNLLIILEQTLINKAHLKEEQKS